MSFNAAAEVGKYLKVIRNDMVIKEIITFTLYCDSQSAIASAKNHVHQYRSKNIDINFHFIRNELQNEALILIHIAKEENG